MTSARKSALAAGLFYLLSFISMPTLVLYSAVHAPGYIVGPGPDTGVLVGAILELMAAGRSNRGIAEVLCVTVPAVERHITSIFAKLGLRQAADDHRRVLAVLQFLRH